ncbi:MAG TPA: hypothetical protein VGN88_11085 [Phycisphaerae bacterium]|jgi:hypothetical protein
MTTKLLESVFQKAANLPPNLQDELARQWLAEMDDEQHWDQQFSQSADAIDTLAERALREHAQGKTLSKGIDEL